MEKNVGCGCAIFFEVSKVKRFRGMGEERMEMEKRAEAFGMYRSFERGSIFYLLIDCVRFCIRKPLVKLGVPKKTHEFFWVRWKIVMKIRGKKLRRMGEEGNEVLSSEFLVLR